VRHALSDLPVLPAVPAPDAVVLSWASWERVTEHAVILRLLALALLLAVANTVALLTSTRPTIRFQTTEGAVFTPQELRGGSPLRGNTPADLDTVRALAQHIAWLRSNWDAATVTARLDSVVALSTTTGRQALLATVPMGLITSIVRDDAGTLSAREDGHGAVVVGESKGRVRATVPMRGRIISKHLPLDAPLGGAPTFGTLTMWFVHQPDGWRLDKLTGDVLSSSVLELWSRYDVAARPNLIWTDHGRPVTADSAVRLAWQRPPEVRW
jgi:hypothetical protein